MSEQLAQLAGIHVTVDDVLYMPSLDAPEDRPHPFVYFITIHNDGNEPVTVCGRKWVVIQESGVKHVVEGEGVVGQFPRIDPEGSFSYNSFHVVGQDSRVSGAFLLETKSGSFGYVPIPEFDLCLPRWV
jgi:ApaG protein